MTWSIYQPGQTRFVMGFIWVLVITFVLMANIALGVGTEIYQDKDDMYTKALGICRKE